MLSITDVHRTFGSRRALDGVTLSLPPGVHALLGPNGSGKSTLMKVVSGALSPSRGSVSFSSFTHPSLELKALTGFVPDVGGLFPRLSALEHLELNARLRNVKEWERPARELLDLLGLADVASSRVSTFSHGMSRKLSAAIAFQFEPALVLLDEPFDGVDPVGVDVVKELTMQAASRDATVLISTHLIDLAQEMASSVTVLRSGRLAAHGDFASLTKDSGSMSFGDFYRGLF